MLPKKVFKTLILISFLGTVSCWESDAENAAEDIGEKIQEVGEDIGDSVEDAASSSK